MEAAKYIVDGNMAADIDGPSFVTGPRGDVILIASWLNTGAATGTLSLQWLDTGGATPTWRDVPGASAEFTANNNVQPANNNATIVCYWRELYVFRNGLRIKYTRSSGGTSNTSLQARLLLE